MGLFGEDKTINVIAEFKAKAGSEEVVRALFVALVAPSRKEKGCKEYILSEDKKQPGTFFTYETWTSEEALADHLAGAKAMLDQAQHMLDGGLRISILKQLA